MLKPAMIRIKTREELGGRPEGWNDAGDMDYLFGQTVRARLDDGDGSAFVDGVWWVFKGQFEVVDAPLSSNLAEEVVVRVKTEEELGGRPGSWNSEGGMDYLFGRTIRAVRRGQDFYVLNRNMDFFLEIRDWRLLADQVEILEVLNG